MTVVVLTSSSVPPQGLGAAWRLVRPRRRTLILCGSLFISLAIVAVFHRSPYFPYSLYDFFPTSLVPSSSSSSSSSTLVVAQENRESSSSSSCIKLVDDIHWMNNKMALNNNSSSEDEDPWKWDENIAAACDIHKVNKSEMGDMFNGSWLMVAGDSQTRHFVNNFLSLILTDEEMVDVRFDAKHRDYRFQVDRLGLTVDFKWAPYARILTRLVLELSRNKTSPDVFVMGCGIWSMQYISKAGKFGKALGSLNEAITSFMVELPSNYSRPPRFFWLNLPILVNDKFMHKVQKENITEIVKSEYDETLSKSKLLNRADPPFMVLDLKSLSRNCGTECTLDGVHYDKPVYEASIQIMLNILIIQSYHKP